METKKCLMFKEMANSDTPAEVIGEIQTNDNRVASFIPILELETMLDIFDWSTSNFQYQFIKDGYANLCVAASLELSITYNCCEDKISKTRTFVGACNFALKSIEPNTHFLATAKSECIKNAASDIGKYFGRGLNNNIVPSQKEPITKFLAKKKPDSKIMRQFGEALAEGDKATITMISNIYDINPTKIDASQE